jgi:2-aminobenzoate-CoA ligase
MLASGKADQLSTLRRAVSAGEHLPATTWRAFRDSTGIQLIDGIGSTELLHIFISAADEDNPAPPGTAGRLAVKGPTGCRYLADPRQASYVQGGWNVTGDVFVQDEDGYFWYRARNDDMIISSGYNIAGPEVEEAVMAHPAVAECAVVGVPDEARGQVVKAFVVPAAGVVADDALVHELQDFVKQRIAPYKYPRVVAFLDALPRTSTGKVQRFVLRDRVASEPAEPGATATQGASRRRGRHSAHRGHRRRPGRPLLRGPGQAARPEARDRGLGAQRRRRHLRLRRRLLRRDARRHRVGRPRGLRADAA